MPTQPVLTHFEGAFGGLVPLMAGSWLLVVAMLPPLLFFGLGTLYLWRLALAAVRGRSDSTVEVESGGGTVRFVIVMPAHDEAMVLATSLTSLRELDYPQESYCVVVVADNCTDTTAQIAREAGVLVLERNEPERHGKGYALAFVQRWLLGQGEEGLPTPPAWDALVVLDADTIPAANMLTAFAHRLEAGQEALQANYQVLNADESWRTRLMSAALALNHVVKPLGREQLGLSDGLKGNGMAFARAVVARVAWPEADLTEDIAYTLLLCRAGVRVRFVAETQVAAQMPTTGQQAAGQRRRWEAGRAHLRRTVAPALLREGIRTHDRQRRDRAYDLFLPPFAEMFAVPLLLLLVCLACGGGLHLRVGLLLALAWGVVLLLEAGYLALGLWVARVPRSVALAVLVAPVYIVWKIGILVLRLPTKRSHRWQRTERRRM